MPNQREMLNVKCQPYLLFSDNCKLPLNWRGEWFQSGVVSSIQIDDKSIGDKGSCIERSGDKFLFYEK